MDINADPLKISQLTKSYSSSIGVENINLELIHGEVFGFLGPNGAGKSTTIRTILNFLQPTAGSIEVFGLDSVEDSVEIKKYIGYLAGDIALYEHMSGRQLLQYLSSLRKNTDWQYVARLEYALEADLERPIKSLSKGNKQKIGLIQAFMHKPKLIILDEPASGLDPLMKQVFYNLVKEAQAEGTTFFISSHDLTEVQKICDRAAFVRDGKLIAIEDINDSRNPLKLKRYFVDFAAAPNKKELAKLPGVGAVTTKGNDAVFSVTGNVSSFIKALAKYEIVDLKSVEISLEDVFMHYYKSDKESL